MLSWMSASARWLPDLAGALKYARGYQRRASSLIDETSTIATFIGRNGPGCQQVAYRVTDVEQVSAVLRERGLRLLYDAPRRGTSDSRINFVHPKDAGGVLVELVEPAAAP